MLRLSQYFSIWVLSSLLFACVNMNHPIHNIDYAIILPNNDHTLSMKDIKTAIIKAGAKRGWVFSDAGKNGLQGTLLVRQHTAKVVVKFTLKSYSIIYKDSTNLNYDGETIHGRYNTWIKNLQRDIELQLNMLAF